MNILLIDDHAVVRAGLSRMLAAAGAHRVHEAATGREGVARARSEPPDLVIADLNLPELGGIELIARLRQAVPTPILVLTMHTEPLYVRRALEAGAQGYVSKNASPEVLLRAIVQVGEGGHFIEPDLAAALAEALSPQPAGAVASLTQLPPRDLEILRHLAAGRSLSDIADLLGISYKTVANNCTQIKSRLGVARTADLLRLALEAGLG